MYQDYITTQDEAVCHLFLHCCFKDGNFSKDEIDNVASKFVELQMHKDLNFKEEMQHYQTYKDSIGNETEYLQFLIKVINAVHQLALYSYCVELCLSDQSLSLEEEALLEKIAEILGIIESKSLIDKLMIQREAVEVEKIF